MFACLFVAFSTACTASNGDAGATAQDESGSAPVAVSQTTSTEGVDSLATSTEAAAITPVEAHGALHVEGTHIVDERGALFQIRGVSTHGLAWFPQYANAEAFSTWESWGANTVRLALYTAESGGYCTSDDAQRTQLLEVLCNGVDAATADGMYAIIDWHILSDGNPQTHREEAESFFEEISARYADHDNVLYEICNEPNGGTSWSDIRDYADDIIGIIRANDPDAIIIVGTPTWSQDVDAAAADPLSDGNVVYALHFYAATHGRGLRDKATKAIDAGLPLLVSEFGICDASGNGVIDESSADTWMAFLDGNGTGSVCWNLSNKDEASALVSSGCAKTSGWNDDELSAEGRWYKRTLLAASGSSARAGATSTGTATGIGMDAAGNASAANDVGAGGASTAEAAGDAHAAGADMPDDAGTVTATGSGGASTGLSVACTPVNYWESDGECYVQYAVTARNEGAVDIDSWSVGLSFASDVALSDGWCAIFDSQGSTITVVPADYASHIAAGTTVSQVGFIVHGSTRPTLTRADIL